jgi:hypothetical protein
LKTVFLRICTTYLSTGNDNIHTITSQGRYKLRINIEDFSGDSRYAVYNLFIVGDEASQYKLDVGGYINIHKEHLHDTFILLLTNY